MKSTKALLCCGVATSALLMSYPAFAADDLATQIQIMRQQIQKQAQEIQQQQQQIQQQQQQLQNLAAGVDQSKAQASQAQAAATAAQQKVATAPPPSGFSVGPTFGDLHYGSATLHVGGKLQIDAPLYAKDNYNGSQGPGTQKLGSAANLRRGYLDLKGNLDPNWLYRFEFGLSNGQTLNLAWAYMGYTGFQKAIGSPLNIWFGYQKTMFSLDNQTADESRLFTEGPLPVNALVSSKSIGPAAFDSGNWWMLSGGLFNGGTGAPTASSSAVNNGWQVSGRGALFPINQDGMLTEIGGSLAYQKPPSTDTFGGFKTQPEENTVGTSLVSTTTSINAQSMTSASIEAAAQYHQFLAEGEWLGNWMARVPTKATPSQPYVSGWYAQAAWTITGETHPWDAPTATFKSITPAHPFDPFGTGGWGGWEVAGRYSHVNLDDVGGLGAPSSTNLMGKESDFTAAINWYMTPNVRGELDWTHVFPINAPALSTGNFNNVSANIVEVRGQVVW